MRMPVTGISAMPRSGRSPVSRSATTTGTTPAAIGRAAHHQVRLGVIRRPAVRTAATNISSRKPSRSPGERTTQPMSRETAASWAAARTPATAISRDRPSDAQAATAVADTRSTASTPPSAGLTGSSTRSP